MKVRKSRSQAKRDVTTRVWNGMGPFSEGERDRNVFDFTVWTVRMSVLSSFSDEINHEVI